MTAQRSAAAMALLLLVPLCLSCVPFGDCWPDITPAVRVDPRLENQGSARVVVAQVVQIDEGDVRGVDAQEVPIADQLTVLGPPPNNGFPYPTWFIAFLDANGNRRLDAGEPFGVDPRNPVPLTCESYTSEIAIDRVRQ